MPHTNLGPTDFAPIRHDDRMHRPDGPRSVGLDEGAATADVPKLQGSDRLQRSREISDDFEPRPAAAIRHATPAAHGLFHAALGLKPAVVSNARERLTRPNSKPYGLWPKACVRSGW